jgi:hypothetical protein
MKISGLKHEVCGDHIALLIPFHGTEFRCLIDPEDLNLIRERCSAVNIFQPKSGVFYARVYSDGEQISLHRFLLGLKLNDGQIGDHKNVDTLDCRRANLRPATISMNRLNQWGVRSDKGIGIRSIFPRHGKWLAVVSREKVGLFSDLRDAVEAVWLRLLELDPIAATSFLRSLPARA